MMLIHITLLTASSVGHSREDFQAACAADGGKQALCCAIPVVRKFYLILVETVLKRDGT
jgi:hypothetical protein